MDEKVKVGVITTGTLLVTEGLDFVVKAGDIQNKIVGLSLVGMGTVLSTVGLYALIKQLLEKVINKVLNDIAEAFE